MPLLIVTWLLIIYGILALFSVSIHESFTKTLFWISEWTWTGEASNYFYFFNQLSNVFYVIILGYITYLFPLKFLKNKHFLIVLLVGLMILQLLVFTPRWVTYGGATWRLDIPWLPSIQPMEFFQLWYVIFISRWLVRKEHLLWSINILSKFFVLNAIILFVFVLIPDFWAVLIMALTGIIMAIYAGVHLRYVLVMFLIGLAWLSVIFWIWLWVNNKYCKDTPRSQQPWICKYAYITNRIEAYINPSIDESWQNITWQNRQALIAIGGGGFFGKWYGKWLQKFWYIPEAQWDFVFAAFAEEVGFVGTLILFALYSALIIIVLQKVGEVKDPFFKNIAVWLLSLIIIAAFIHIGVNVQVLPNTWLTLPFVSYGWTSLMVNTISIILLYKILYRNTRTIY